MKSTENETNQQAFDTDVSRAISLIYETMLSPNLAAGLAERDTSTYGSIQVEQLENSVFNSALIEQILPHFNHALELAEKQRITDKTPVPRNSYSPPRILFDDLPLPVCIISRQLELLSINDKARVMLQKDCHLPQPAEHALTIDQQLKQDLLNAVATSIDSGQRHTLNCHTDTGVARSILVIPNQQENSARTTGQERSAQILFLNFEAGIDELTSALVNVYELTPSEAQVTAYLSQGSSLEEIAEKKGCSVHTIRTQIKCAYTKTGTRRQGQLVSLALNGPAVWLNVIRNNNTGWHESSLLINSSENTLQLKDGRLLGYGDYGPRNGKPVVLCHHLLGSRKEKPFDEDLLQELGVRLIVPERPGVGFSSGAEDRSLSNWAEDVRQLADHLDLKHFYMAGLSSGGPHAAACASVLEDRVIKLGLIASQMPIDELPAGTTIGYMQRFMTTMARHWPAPLQKILESRYSKLLENPDSAISQFKDEGNIADRALLQDFQINQFRLQNLRDASHLPTSFFAKELMTLSRPWGFNLSELTIPVIMWHGKLDDYFPIEHAEAIAGLIPNCQTHFSDDWAHFFLYEEWKKVLGTLVH